MSLHVRWLRPATRAVAAGVVALTVLAGSPAAAQADPAVPAPVTEPAPEPGDAVPTPEPTPTPGPPPTPEPQPAPEPVPAPAPADEDVRSGDTVTGTVVRVYADDGEDPADVETWIDTGDGQAVRVESGDLDEVPVQSTVEVTVGAAVAAEPGTPAGTPLTHEVLDVEMLAPAPETPPAPSDDAAPALVTATNMLTIVLVQPAGSTRDATTPAQVVAHVNDDVAPWWATESGGTVQIAVAAAHDWLTSTRPCSDTWGLWSDAAAAAGWTAGAGKHLFVYLPTNTPDCGGAIGRGTLGSAPSTGGQLWVMGISSLVSEHELGHNFGLGHSGSTQCDSAVETGTCATVEYGDVYDVMGNWNDGSLNVVQAARIGLLPAGRQQTLASAGTGGSYTLAPNSGSSGVRAIKLTDASGAVYWLEYRTPAGADAYLGDRGFNGPPPDGLQPGVLLHRTPTGTSGPTSMLLDPSPSAAGQYDVGYALPIGAGVSFSGGNFTVTVQNVTASAATLWIATRTTAAAPAATPIQIAYQASGAINGPLGLALSAQGCGLHGGGCSQSFAGGSIYWSTATGAHAISHPGIATQWSAAGGLGGTLGYPTGDTVCDSVGRTCEQTFQGGTVVAGATGTHAVTAPFDTAWADRGAADGVLGRPTAAAQCGLTGGGCMQSFDYGVLYWTAATGAHMVSTDRNTWPDSTQLTDRWLADGGQDGPLGYPTADAVCGLTSGGCRQPFQHGTVYDSWHGTAVMVPGPITNLWLAAGAEDGRFGYPTGDAACDPAGCVQSFAEGATIVWTQATGPRTLSDQAGTAWTGFATAWSGNGAGAGPLGYPTGDAVCGLRNGGCLQQFQTGTLYRGPSGGPQVVLNNAIRTYWAARSFEMGALGYPTSGPVCDLPGGGCAQSFEHGQRVVWSATTGARAVVPAMSRAWDETGGASGTLGYPTGDQFCGLKDGGCGQHFQRGSVYSTRYGSDAVHGAIRDAWAARGWEIGPWGYPSGPAGCGLAGGGCQQRFSSGVTVAWSPSTGARAIPGSFEWTWTGAGGVGGSLGYPTSDQFCGLRDFGCGQHFQAGSIYSSPYTGTFAIPQAIRDGWASAGWEIGVGYPISGAFCGLKDGGCGQRFSTGTVYSSPATGARAVSGRIRDAYGAQGWELGALGYPTTNAFCGLRNGGCGQKFSHGSIYWSPATDARTVSGPIRDRWAARGWEGGELGYPTTNPFCGLRNGGCGQHFQGGSVYSSSATGARMVSGLIRDAYAAQGWETGALGYPTTDPFCGLPGGGCGQHFVGGSIYWSPASGARIVSGLIKDRWSAQGWEAGALGYPTTNPFCGLRDRGCGQHFQGGSIYWSPTTGAHAVAGIVRDRWAALGWEGNLGYPTGAATTSGRQVSQTFQRATITLAF